MALSTVNSYFHVGKGFVDTCSSSVRVTGSDCEFKRRGKRDIFVAKRKYQFGTTAVQAKAVVSVGPPELGENEFALVTDDVLAYLRYAYGGLLRPVRREDPQVSNSGRVQGPEDDSVLESVLRWPSDVPQEEGQSGLEECELTFNHMFELFNQGSILEERRSPLGEFNMSF